jgi:hypothetical protein
MPDTRYFDAIAQNLAEGMGAPGGSLESIVDQLRRTAQDVARAQSVDTPSRDLCRGEARRCLRLRPRR